MPEQPAVTELVKNPFPEDIRNRSTKKQILLTASVTARDKEIAGWLAAFFGTSRSDVLRTAVRHLYSEVSAGVYQRPMDQ